MLNLNKTVLEPLQETFFLFKGMSIRCQLPTPSATSTAKVSFETEGQPTPLPTKTTLSGPYRPAKGSDVDRLSSQLSKLLINAVSPEELQRILKDNRANTMEKIETMLAKMMQNGTVLPNQVGTMVEVKEVIQGEVITVGVGVDMEDTVEGTQADLRTRQKSTASHSMSTKEARSKWVPHGIMAEDRERSTVLVATAGTRTICPGKEKICISTQTTAHLWKNSSTSELSTNSESSL
jgi:hypothetical protein